MADITPMGERTAVLEANDRTRKEQVDEIFHLLRQSAEANRATAEQQVATQTQLNLMATTVNKHDADITQLKQVLWMGRGVLWFVGGGGVAIGTAIGFILKFSGGH